MRINSTHHLKGTYFIGASGVALTLLAGALLFPSLPDGASAADPSASTAIRTNVNVAPILSLSVGNPATNTATVEVTPTENGTFRSKTLPVTVSTNNETGYSLYLSIADGKTDNRLKPSAATNSSVINPVTGTPTSTSFAANTWGYNLSTSVPDTNTAYSAVPLDRTTPQQTTTAPTSGDGDSYNLTFGTKVDTDLPADTYSTQVVLSAVTNPAYVAIFNGIKTMQEMTVSICADATEGDTAQLTDTRDQKQYWVTKLADGNCWMTQNLDYDIPAGGITGDQAAKTDLSDGRTWATGDPSPSNPHPAQATSTEIYYNTSYTGTYSYDPGLVVVSGTEFVPYESRPEGTDEHQLVGNYYQWNAATAGTGALVSQKGEDATDSICPKGWQLPTLTGDTSAYNLMTSYPDIFSGLALEDNNTGTATDAAIQDPLFFGYTGLVLGGAMSDVGQYSSYWLSTAYSEYRAYSFGVAPGMATASGWDSRNDGFSIRCLAPSA